jgi:hypothetical protein
MSGLGQPSAAAKKQEEEALKKKRDDIRRMYKRLDGKQLKDKQVDLLVKEYEEARKRELEFDPRKHRLKNGIRNIDVNEIKGIKAFTGKGVQLG